MSTRAAASVLALIVMAIGLVLGLVPHSIDVNLADQQTQSCGSAFAPKSAADLHLTQVVNDYANAIGASDSTGQQTIAQQTIAQQCSEAVGTPRAIALVLIGLGAIVGLFTLLTTPKRSPEPAAS